MNNNDNYLNRANPNPLLEAMPSNTKLRSSDKYTLIYLNCSTAVFDVLNDRIQTMAKESLRSLFL